MINLGNLLRIGTVSSINYPAGRVRVCFTDQDKIVTDELPMLSHEYEMPNVGEMVLCLFLGNGITKGFCLGRYFYNADPPVESGKDIYFKRFMKDATLKYDRASKTLTITSANGVFNGNIVINGNVTINGELTVTGDATIGGISFLNHGHPYSWTDPGGSGTTGPPV
jgi:phage baseplate assembly protein gpV